MVSDLMTKMGGMEARLANMEKMLTGGAGGQQGPAGQKARSSANLAKASKPMLGSGGDESDNANMRGEDEDEDNNDDDDDDNNNGGDNNNNYDHDYADENNDGDEY